MIYFGLSLYTLSQKHSVLQKIKKSVAEKMAEIRAEISSFWLFFSYFVRNGKRCVFSWESLYLIENQQWNMLKEAKKVVHP